MIEIKHQFSDETLKTFDLDTLAGADLSRVNLAVALMTGFDLRARTWKKPTSRSPTSPGRTSPAAT